MTNNAAYIRALEKENNDNRRISELEAQLAAVRGCQRYTHHAGAYTTDNPTGKWMKSEDVLAALQEQKP